MNDQWHEKITVEILRQTFSTSALKIIRDANVDSDKPGIDGGASQHFHFHGRHAQSPDEVIRDSTDFWMSCMEYAAILARSGTNNHMEMALYFIGRGLHCAQDFYAHSNFVALNQGTYWKMKLMPGLTFCLPTPPVSSLGKIKLNRPTYWPDIPDPTGKSKFLKGDELKRVSVERMMDGNSQLEHPELHLDFPNSWADRAITTIRGDRAWDRAKNGACSITVEAYEYFEGEMVNSPRKTMVMRLDASLKKEGAEPLTKKATDHQGGNKALVELKAFDPGRMKYARTSSKCAGVFVSTISDGREQRDGTKAGRVWDAWQSTKRFRT